VLSVISFVAVLSVLVIVHEFGHFIIAKRIGVRVEKFSIGFGPEIFGITKGDTRYIISLIPLGGYVKMTGETSEENIKGEKWEYLSRSAGERARIIFAGPLLNYVLAFLIFSFVFMIGYPTFTTKIGNLLPEYPGQIAGLKEGDRILKINGNDVRYWDEVTAMVHTNKDPDIELLIDRDGERIGLTVKTKSEDIKTVFGSKVKVGLMGIMPAMDVTYVKYNLPRAAYEGSRKLFTLTYITYRALWASLTGAVPFKESVTGPIGIFYITGQAARLGFVYLLHLMGVLSASLAIFNLLPVPVLDGGHILFLVIEKIRRKPLSRKLQENMTQAGLMLLICLMLFVFYNDFMRFGVLAKITALFQK
jgi:regulator of sigma E protease